VRCAALALVGLVGCTRVPYTHRPQDLTVPSSLSAALGQTTYAAVRARDTRLAATEDARRVAEVGSAVGRAAQLSGATWEVTLFDRDTVDLWCLPGGYVGVHAGALPVARDEAGLAHALGHAVAHAVARHPAERLGQQLALFGGLSGLFASLDPRTPLSPAARGALWGALGVGDADTVAPPFARLQEEEADVIGLLLAAGAGFPPSAAGDFWDRLAARTHDPGTRAFRTLHPADGDRRARLAAWLPLAEKKYARNRRDGDPTVARW
jgi:predicted Zn-dependent protease